MKTKTSKKEELLLASDYNKKRFRHIQEALMEAAIGNFSYRIGPSGKDDPLAALAAMTNMVMEELEALFTNKGYEETKGPSINLTAFVLDGQWHIQALHPHIPGLLYWDASDMIGKPLDSLLTRESQTTLGNIKKLVQRKKTVNETVELCFTTGNNLTFPVQCNISSLFSGFKRTGKEVGITFHEVAPGQEASLEYLMEHHKEKIQELKTEKRVTLRNTDVRSIRNIHNHIKRHPEGPIPSLKNLAHNFGINEFKLKYGFKQLYGTPVFSFLREERMKRVKLLIQTTEMPLKDIARITGFKDASHFTRAFKKQ